MEHGHSLVIPPHFEGNNYTYWKVRMKAFLKSIDERVWNSVEYEWEKPTAPVSEWQTSQKEAAAFNSKAMNRSEERRVGKECSCSMTTGVNDQLSDQKINNKRVIRSDTT